MKRNIRPTSRFTKDLKLMKRHGKELDKIEKVVDMLAGDIPLSAEKRDHNLKGQWSETRECHVEPDWLLIYRKVDNELILVRTGSHADLFE
jgi:mRNA interferase YafQ